MLMRVSPTCAFVPLASRIFSVTTTAFWSTSSVTGSVPRMTLRPVARSDGRCRLTWDCMLYMRLPLPYLPATKRRAIHGLLTTSTLLTGGEHGVLFVVVGGFEVGLADAEQRHFRLHKHREHAASGFRCGSAAGRRRPTRPKSMLRYWLKPVAVKRNAPWRDHVGRVGVLRVEADVVVAVALLEHQAGGAADLLDGVPERRILEVEAVESGWGR